MSAELKATRRDATLILTLSDPGTRNAMHPDMAAAGIEAMTTAERDASIRVVVLTGADGFFCSGSNLNRLAANRSLDTPAHADAIDSLHAWIEAIRSCPRPVIAAVDGDAIGAGFSLALACDLIVAGASATFAMTNARLGLTPEGGASWFLSRTLPHQTVNQILLDGEPLSAERLQALGVVNYLAPDGNALDRALRWAEELAAQPAQAIDRIKTLVTEASHQDLSAQLAAERQQFIETLHHRDTQTRIASFLKKRKSTSHDNT